MTYINQAKLVLERYRSAPSTRRARMSTGAILTGVCVVVLTCLAAVKPALSKPVAWNAAASAKYLDQREVYWQDWEHAERDHDTHCISCHTQVPYALARPLLRGPLKEGALSTPEQKLLADVSKRVTLWSETEPFYTEPAATRPKQARGTEAVLNALILSSYDSRTGQLSATTRKAFANAWELQLKTGADAGGWTWLDFHNDPWEGKDSAYQGATYAALAVGIAPDHYQNSPEIEPQLVLLRGYLKGHYSSQPLVNRLMLLWASSKLPGLLTPAEQKAVVAETMALQQADGGWSLTSLGQFKRQDSTELETKSDGYATGLAVLAIEETNGRSGDPRIRSALDWLSKNQSQEEGSWAAYSLNKQRDLKSNVGHFMTDAATGFAVSALAKSR